ncbi:hypothetical protein [Streptomyces sp. NHF165]|uniref:hypothetical protein n=1 Tax=Streptomyces sp. NHF165 TaxID=2175864 RepID=UPI00132EB2F7|nr:hypothetical protein [Streptomyces sp. NHF165]QHF94559.1 hypothetical protein DEH18_12615 [Streptomyces sp. NHF165]
MGGPPAGPPGKSRRRAAIVIASAVAVALLAGGGIFLATRDGGGNKKDDASSSQEQGADDKSSAQPSTDPGEEPSDEATDDSLDESPSADDPEDGEDPEDTENIPSGDATGTGIEAIWMSDGHGALGLFHDDPSDKRKITATLADSGLECRGRYEKRSGAGKYRIALLCEKSGEDAPDRAADATQDGDELKLNWDVGPDKGSTTTFRRYQDPPR